MGNSVACKYLDEMVRGEIDRSTRRDVVSRRADPETTLQDPANSGSTETAQDLLSLGHRATTGLGHIPGPGTGPAPVDPDHARHAGSLAQTPECGDHCVALGDVDTRRTTETDAIAGSHTTAQAFW